MPWNSGGSGPWGNPSGSPGDPDRTGANGRKHESRPPQGPWGNQGDQGEPDDEGGKDGRGNDGGPFGQGPFGKGPFGRDPFGQGPFGQGPFGGGGGPGPDLDRLIAQAQAFIRRLLGGGGKGRGPRGPGGPPSQVASGRRWLLAAIGILVIWVGSGFYRVEPDEQGVVLRFGAYSYWTPPGLHWHLPWPIERVLLPAVTRINRTEIGFRSPAAGDITLQQGGRDQAGRDVLAESLMLTGDENIIDIDVAVFWRVKTNDTAAYLFNTANPDGLVRVVAESSLREVIGRTPIQPALTELRAQIEESVHKQTQEILDRYRAGVEITQVQLQKVDPPGAVIESFRDVQRANTDAERLRNEAEAYRNDIVPRARGDAARIVAEGQGFKAATVAEATGQTQRFDSVLKAYQLAKDVTLRRLYLDTMQDVLSHAQTTVLDDRLKGVLPFLPLTPGTLPGAPPASPAPQSGGTKQ